MPIHTDQRQGKRCIAAFCKNRRHIEKLGGKGRPSFRIREGRMWVGKTRKPSTLTIDPRLAMRIKKERGGPPGMTKDIARGETSH